MRILLALSCVALAPGLVGGQTRDFVTTNRMVLGTPSDLTASIAFADVNGDGDADAILANGRHCSDETRSVVVADLNQDGVLDIVAANIGEPNAVYLGRGGGEFDEGVPFGGDERTYAAVVADVDGNGAPDIVVGNVQGRNAVYLNDGTGRSWLEQLIGEEAEGTYGLAAADLDGDGFPEIGFANSDALNRIFANVERR